MYSYVLYYYIEKSGSNVVSAYISHILCSRINGFKLNKNNISRSINYFKNIENCNVYELTADFLVVEF